MENGTRKGAGRISGRRVLCAIITGAVVFGLCILLFPSVMLKSEDPASFVSAACVGTVALTVFFASVVGAHGGEVHFVLPALVCALTAALLLFGCAFIFGDGDDYAFTVFLAVTALVFSLLGARVGALKSKDGHGKKRRKRYKA